MCYNTHSSRGQYKINDIAQSPSGKAQDFIGSSKGKAREVQTEGGSVPPPMAMTPAFTGSNPVWAAFYIFQASTWRRMGNANWNFDIKGGHNDLAFIYEIVNDVNDKRYIGKTEFDINKRFMEHCKDAFKDRNEKRPLYRAMRKYGIEHFHIYLIEETDDPEEREKYWISQKNTFHYGYNATLGGDGKRFLDYDLIIKTYQEVQSLRETSRICGASVDSIRNILNFNNIKIKSSGDVVKEKFQKAVGMYDKNDHSKLVKTFLSTGDAARYLIDNKVTSATKVDGVNSHIVHVCNDKRESAYGYWWQYLD